jgi:hypothetical protein
LSAAIPARAETDTPIPPSLTTPDQVETSIGTLKFRDSVPDAATVGKLYDQLDLQRGVSAFLNGLRGVSIYAARQGIRDAGVKDNEGVLIFSGLMDSRSLFLTANADTVYFLSNIDLTKGPMVVETPPDTLGLFDDLWFRWVIDFGAPGPDRGQVIVRGRVDPALQFCDRFLVPKGVPAGLRPAVTGCRVARDGGPGGTRRVGCRARLGTCRVRDELAQSGASGTREPGVGRRHGLGADPLLG